MVQYGGFVFIVPDAVTSFVDFAKIIQICRERERWRIERGREHFIEIVESMSWMIQITGFSGLTGTKIVHASNH